RLWCDMAVCGNRQKANRYYRRRTAAREATNA
ncbi:CGNR zinc finger domain-containing protein, partial [Mesorhizobium sp.]